MSKLNKITVILLLLIAVSIADGLDTDSLDPNNLHDLVRASKERLYWDHDNKEWFYNGNGSEYVISKYGFMADYQAEWHREHDPNNNLHYYIRDSDGIYVPNSFLCWSVIILGFILALFCTPLLVVVGILLALVDLHLLSFYLVYGVLPGWVLVLIIIFLTPKD